MGNLTEAFIDIVEKIEKERGIEPSKQSFTSLIGDTFVKEAIDLFTHVLKLKTFLESIKPSYLLSDTGKYSSKSEGNLTEEQRDDIDIQARIELKKFTERLKHLEKYEKQRADSKKYFRYNQSQASAINKHREGILLSLSHELRSTSKLLLSMQETRLSRQRDLDLGADKLSAINVISAKYNVVPDDSHHIVNIDEISQEQLQTLQTEQSEILDGKLEELAKVEQIHKSVVEIAQLESQLASHLQVQSEHINSLVNDHDVTHIDIVEGHKHLKKAKSRGNYAAKMVMFTAVFLGIILLVFDAIN